ncbi:MAG: diguanylate cyclase [Planctomycetales bacterium]|nr:diguanylate cyclase [Planctomycetales bacterium]NIM07573.1 diguanylate cyclase [Planctomycetales bacterium]NIN07079.1 diguanylate cyclase [Planctomycetales bacterium]NIN76173.1 diguanylate cyclase [Planctomycetales bacterium]NIO33395.1 diguanylate cyclase [Planctomycetales bacterium]
MNTLISILPWVIGSVAVGLGIGFYLGMSRYADKDKDRMDAERDLTFRVLSELLSATEQLTSEVSERNVEIKEVGEDLIGLDLEGDLQVIQHRLMKQVSSVLESNMRLEDDLTVTRCQVEQQAEIIDEARREARTDALSGVGNRKAMDERLTAMLAHCRRSGTPFALLLADVDHFKWVNDTHGHAAGDVLVAHIGEFLKKCVRTKDFVARYGGDEFALMLTEADADTALRAAERLRNNVCEQTFDLGRGAEEVAVTFSIGVACSWREGSATQILKRADNALYQAKANGRNTACCYWEGNVISVNKALELSHPKTAIPPAEGEAEVNGPDPAEASAQNASSQPPAADEADPLPALQEQDLTPPPTTQPTG